MRSIDLELQPSACFQCSVWESLVLTLPSLVTAHSSWMSLIKRLRRCHPLCSLVLLAAAARSIFRLGFMRSHYFQPPRLLCIQPSQRAVARAMHVWRDGVLAADCSTVQRQRLQLLRFSGALGTVAVRMTSTDQQRFDPAHGALIMRRCLSMHGVEHLLRLLDHDDDDCDTHTDSEDADDGDGGDDDGGNDDDDDDDDDDEDDDDDDDDDSNNDDNYNGDDDDGECVGSCDDA